VSPFTIDRKIKRLVRLAEEEDITVEEFKQRIEELKKQKALLLANQITKLDNCKISEKLKTVVSIYPYMTREEKSRLWHLLIIRIEAGKSLISVYWRGGGKYTFKRQRLEKNLKVLNTKGRSVVAGGFEPRTDNISKFFSDLERLLNSRNVFDEG
jgi:hypothetical protein